MTNKQEQHKVDNEQDKEEIKVEDTQPFPDKKIVVEKESLAHVALQRQSEIATKEMTDTTVIRPSQDEKDED